MESLKIERFTKLNYASMLDCVYNIWFTNSTYNVSSFLSFHRRRRDDRHPDGVLPHVVQDPGVADRVGDHRVDAHDEVEQQELFREVRR